MPAARLDDRFARYDSLTRGGGRSARANGADTGELHAANTINTDSGLVLVDWDSALIAPRERDLWSLAVEEPASLLLHYTAKTGVTPLPDFLELYRLRWDLTEVSRYVALFRAPHDDTADTRVAWTASTPYRRSAHCRHEGRRWSRSITACGEP